jgi:hypothetical protein
MRKEETHCGCIPTSYSLKLLIAAIERAEQRKKEAELDSRNHPGGDPDLRIRVGKEK